MRQILTTIPIFLLIISCSNNKMTRTERNGEPDVYSTPSDDIEMNEAIAKAKSTIYQFDKAFQSNKFDKSTFALKMRFQTEKGAEHIWSTNIQLNDKAYYGIVDNLPNTTTQVKLGEKIKLNKEKITDWMYADNGTLRGGYTIRLLRSRMTQQEKNQFDTTFHLKIETNDSFK